MSTSANRTVGDPTHIRGRQGADSGQEPVLSSGTWPEEIGSDQRLPRKPWKRPVFAAVLVLADCLGIWVAFLLAFILRTSILPKLGVQVTTTIPVEPYLDTPWLLLLWPLVLHYEGLYRVGLGTWDELFRLLKALSFAALLVMVATFVSHIAGEVSRIIIVATWLFSLAAVPVLRAYCRTRILLPWQRVGFLLVTGPDAAPETLRRVRIMEDCGYKHLGTLSLDPSSDDAENRAKVRAGILEHRPDEIILCPSELGAGQFHRILRCVETFRSPLRVLSSMPVILKLRATIQNLDGVILLDVQNSLAQPFNRFLKRGMDIAGAVVLLVLCAPIFLVVGILIKLDSRGSTFYGHERLDSRGRVFRCLKFRSMRQDADERLRAWIAAGDERGKEFQADFKLKSDPRVTRVGKFLRKTSLDELPQLINVLAGEMSLVGPRPIVPEEVPKYGKDFQYLLMAKGGMTGLWQVSGRSDVDYGERVALDTYYIRNWSVWSDIVILMKTVVVLLNRAGAY